MQGKILSDSVIRSKDGKAVDIIITKVPFDSTKTFKGFDFSLKFKIIF